MRVSQRPGSIDRRTILKTTAAIAAVQFSSPFIIKARGETPVRIEDPETKTAYVVVREEVYRSLREGAIDESDLSLHEFEDIIPAG